MAVTHGGYIWWLHMAVTYGGHGDLPAACVLYIYMRPFMVEVAVCYTYIYK